MAEEIYREIILDHHKNPRHFGKLQKPTHEAHLENKLCGDEVTMQLKVEGRKIAGAMFQGNGCAITIASSSLLAEHLQGKSLSAVKKLGTKDIDKLLGVKVGPAREKCAYLGLETLQAALKKS